jgi:hypothetical protein
MASRYGSDDIPNIVLIGVPDVDALKAVCQLLSDNQIPHWSWTEPDFDLGFTSITTAAISGDQRRCLAHFRLWREEFIRPWPNCKAVPSKGIDAGAGPAGRTNGAVAERASA